MAMWSVAYRGHSPSPSELMQDEEELERDMQAERELLGYGGPVLEDEESEYEDLAEMRAGEQAHRRAASFWPPPRPRSRTPRCAHGSIAANGQLAAATENSQTAAVVGLAAGAVPTSHP